MSAYILSAGGITDSVGAEFRTKYRACCRASYTQVELDMYAHASMRAQAPGPEHGCLSHDTEPIDTLSSGKNR